MESIKALTIGLYGEIKTAKTTLGLLFPKPIMHFDLDLGIDRAIHRFIKFSLLEVPANQPLPVEALNGHYEIVTKPYYIPIRLPQMPVAGVVGLWEQQFLVDYFLAVNSPHIKTIIIDTGTKLWNMAKEAQLERAQRSNPNRHNLIQIEYTLPNQEIRAVLGAARQTGKNLYIPHHIGGKYEPQPNPQTGRMESTQVGFTWDGWSHLGAAMDLVLKSRTVTEDKKTVPPSSEEIPVVDIETCGYSLRAQNITLPNPTFDTILALVNHFRSQDLEEVVNAQ